MKRAILFVFASLTATLAWPQCVVTGSGHVALQADAACFPTLDEDKCPHYFAGGGKTVGAANVDIDDAKRFGKKVMNFANNRACEGKPTCGPYVLEFKSEAKCEGKIVQDMPGGEYRGLTANKARQILEYTNRQIEQLAKLGEDRGKKPNAKHKGQLWGND